MTTVLSGRARSALMRHQHQLATRAQTVRTIDRVLSGALSACAADAQREMLADYFEAVQELRVSMQRLETLLDARLRRFEPADAMHAAALPVEGS